MALKGFSNWQRWMKKKHESKRIFEKNPYFAEKRTKDGDFCPFLPFLKSPNPIVQNIFSNSKTLRNVCLLVIDKGMCQFLLHQTLYFSQN